MVVYFTNEATKSIPYGTIQQQLFGTRPNVQVYFKDGDEYALSDDMNQITFTGTSIDIDFGGSNTGLIKIFSCLNTHS